jgi:tRNA A37 threonylcarbamoyladenosine synthetase subunit TsaC/SUA5/YrdC
LRAAASWLSHGYFYGLGVNPFDERALRSLNELKGREAKPILIIISDRAQTERFVEAKSALFEILAAHYWPGALTIVEEARRGSPPNSRRTPKQSACVCQTTNKCATL